MYIPPITYLVSSPFGDVPVEADKLDLPLEYDPLMTPYGQYFRSVEGFLKEDEFIPLLQAAAQKTGWEISLNEITEILIRAEKHGLLYHPASIELIINGAQVKFGLNVAVTDTGKRWLREETLLLRELLVKHGLPYLPMPYISGEFNSMVFLLEDWFEGYHEFHITRDKESKHTLRLWEFGTGYLNLANSQSFEIYRQSSKILTLYYDFENFNYIYPWHHAAGDFIVKADNEKIDVRLTTVRRYKPLLDFRRDEINPLFALFYFFLHLSLHMRLDKIDGVGEVVWAEDYSIDAVLQGFSEALRQKNAFNNNPGLYTEFIVLLRSFSLDEIKVSFNPLFDLYAGTKDLPVIGMNLDGHVKKLYDAIQTRL
jgi:hypothetical protein